MGPTVTGWKADFSFNCGIIISNPSFSCHNCLLLCSDAVNNYVHVNTPVSTQSSSSSCVSPGRFMSSNSTSWFLHRAIMCVCVCVCSTNKSDSFHPHGAIKFHWFWSENLQFAAGQEFIQVSVWWGFFFCPSCSPSMCQGHVFPCSSSSSSSLPLSDIVEVEVGT